MTVPKNVKDRLKARFTECPGCGLTKRELRIKCGSKPWNLVLTIDHKKPRSKGGTSSDLNNLIVVCCRCNFLKKDRYPWDWHGDQHLIFALQNPDFVPRKLLA